MGKNIGEQITFEYEGNGRWKEVNNDEGGGGIIIVLILALVLILLLGPAFFTGLALYKKKKGRIMFASISVLFSCYLLIDISQQWYFGRLYNSLLEEFPIAFFIVFITNIIAFITSIIVGLKAYIVLKDENEYKKKCDKYNIPQNGQKILECDINGEKLNSGKEVFYLDDKYEIIDMREIGVIKYLFLLNESDEIKKVSFKKYRENIP